MSQVKSLREADSLSLPSQPITLEDGPFYELTAEEVAVPVMVPDDDGVEHQVNFHVKPYRAYDMKELLNLMGMRFQSKGGERVAMFAGESWHAKPFFDKHFIRLSSADFDVEPSLEEQKAWIEEEDARLNLKETVVIRGYGGISVTIKEATGTKFRLMTGRARAGISAFMTLYDPETRTTNRVTLIHHLRKETEQDSVRYNAATGQSEMHTKKREWYRVEDYDALEQLYDGMAVAASGGYRLRGVPCTVENKAEWIGLIPFWHKSFILDEHFRGVRVRNL